MPDKSPTHKSCAYPSHASTSYGVEETYLALLENLCGFDLEEIESMDRETLLAHWEAASRAWMRLDQKLADGEDLPLDWQSFADDPVALTPTAAGTAAAQSA